MSESISPSAMVDLLCPSLIVVARWARARRSGSTPRYQLLWHTPMAAVGLGVDDLVPWAVVFAAVTAVGTALWTYQWRCDERARAELKLRTD